MTSRLIQAPVNRIMRNPNFPGSSSGANFARGDCLLNQVKFLEDPENNRKLVLIGTLNASNLLAERTHQLLNRIKPDSVLVQTTPRWFDEVTQNLGDRAPLTNEEVFNSDFKPLLEIGRMENNLRTLVFKSKMHMWMLVMKSFFNFATVNNSPFKPGLEAYRAIQYARETKAEVLYAGRLFNPQVLRHLYLEKRMYVVPLMWRMLNYNSNTYWNQEHESFSGQLSVHGLKNFSESVDDATINWYIKLLERIAPYQKRILIDQEDDRLFHSIYQDMPGKTLVAVVNQWHVPGIEYHWRHTTGTEIKSEFINPIGDFDIDGRAESKLINDTLRRIKSKAARTEPAVTSDYLVTYHKQNIEPERERHVFFSGYDDPELEHGLYNDENKDVKNLPYENHGHGHH